MARFRTLAATAVATLLIAGSALALGKAGPVPRRGLPGATGDERLPLGHR